MHRKGKILSAKFKQHLTCFEMAKFLQKATLLVQGGWIHRRYHNVLSVGGLHPVLLDLGICGELG